jgi:hypothetical protein
MRQRLKLYVKSADLAITRVIEPRTMTEPCGAANQFVQGSDVGENVAFWEFVRSFAKD